MTDLEAFSTRELVVGDEVKVYLTDCNEVAKGLVVKVFSGWVYKFSVSYDFILVDQEPIGNNPGGIVFFRRYSSGVYVARNGSTI